MKPCPNCDPTLNHPGRTIAVDKDGRCSKCGGLVVEVVIGGVIPTIKALKRWDKYFHSICTAVASKSPCLSRQIGAILVRDKSIVATGYNGPARGYPHCGGDEIADWMVNTAEASMRKGIGKKSPKIPLPSKESICPRRAKGYKSGEGLAECPAAHAEGNCIANAARLGVSVVNATLYMNCIIPCKDCMILLVNAGVVEVVVEKVDLYHEMSEGIAKHGGISIRKFEL